MKLTVGFDIEDDVEAKLSEIVWLSCTDHCKEVEVHLQLFLSPHRNLFSVAAEYEDFLFRHTATAQEIIFLASSTPQNLTRR